MPDTMYEVGLLNGEVELESTTSSHDILSCSIEVTPISVNEYLDGEVDINNESYDHDINSELNIDQIPISTLLDAEADIVNEEYGYTLPSTMITTLPRLDTDLPGELSITSEGYLYDLTSSITIHDPKTSIKYIADITGNMDIRYNNTQIDIGSKIIVRNPYNPVVYQGWITGHLNLNASDTNDLPNMEFPCSLEVPRIMYEKIILGETYLPYENIDNQIEGEVQINKERLNIDLMGEFRYDMEPLNIDIESILFTPASKHVDIDGTVDISNETLDYDIPSTINIQGVHFEKEILNGELIMHDAFKAIKDLYGNLGYRAQVLEDNENNEITGKVTVNQWVSRYDINCRLQVPWHGILYTFLSRMNVVWGIDKDIESTLTVSGDHVYDLDATVNLEYSFLEEDKLLEGNLTMNPHAWADIDGELELERIDTRRDINSNIFVVAPVDYEFVGAITVLNKYQQYIRDLSSAIRVGNDYTCSFESSMVVENPSIFNLDLPSAMEVRTDLVPARIVIFVDPLWQYEPYVLKNAVSTFLDRVFLTTNLSLVYGGSPRANWDIRHFAGIYRIEPFQQFEIPFDFYPGNPVMTRDSMRRFVHAMFKFPPQVQRKTIDKVFVFSNNPYAHTSTYLNPLFEACKMYNINITVVTSRGEITGSDPASGAYINRTTVDHNLPLDAQPHWQFGAGTKHRDLFDDRPI